MEAFMEDKISAYHDVMSLIQAHRQETELAAIISYNDKTHIFNLSLTEEDAKQLIICRNESLKKYRRVEFGVGILDKLIFTFCDSQYIEQESYLETLMKLQDIFYEYKNEAEEKLTDDELLTFMREQFEDICFGDLDYLEGTCLKIFTEAIRSGYQGYIQSGGSGDYSAFDEVPRWDKDLYMSVVKELFWG